MAKVQYGLIVTEASGKAGNLVYTRSHGGAYVRKSPTFIQPITPHVTAVRNTMRTVGKLWWTTLTDNQRSAWRAFAQQIKWRDRIGQPASPAGSDLFTQLNFNIANLGGSPILAPPNSLSAPDPGPLTCSASATTGQVLVTPTTPAPPNHAPLLRATKPLKPGWFYFNRFLAQLRPQADLSSPVTLPDVSAPYAYRHGPPIAGYKIGFSLQYVNLTTGAISPAQTTLTTTTGEPDVLTTTITITNPQMLALKETPVQLIPAPGPGKAVLFIAAFARLNPGLTSFAVPPDYNDYCAWLGPQPTLASITLSGQFLPTPRFPRCGHGHIRNLLTNRRLRRPRQRRRPTPHVRLPLRHLRRPHPRHRDIDHHHPLSNRPNNLTPSTTHNKTH